MPNPLYRQHIISISDLSREQLECLLQTALKLNAHPRDDLLEAQTYRSMLLRTVHAHEAVV